MNLIHVSILLLSLVSSWAKSPKHFPLNFNYTYKFLQLDNKSSVVDTSNPWKFKLINTKEIIDQWGYQGEEHNVTTEDGYIISIYRILPKREHSPPVLILHGFLACSETFVLRGPNEDLAFILSDAGYDVWLGNYRGNSNGRHHVNLSVHDEAFWKFSLHELGAYDLPAFTDHILAASSATQLALVCHSYSNAVAMVMGSARPQYVGRVSLLVGLAPFVFASHLRYGPLLRLFLVPLKRYCYKACKFELFERRDINPVVRICDMLPYVCILWYSLIVGTSSAKYEVELTPAGLAYFPSGTNLFTLMHIATIFTRRRFCQLDLGAAENRRRYGMDAPPDYDLSRARMPYVIYAGTNDYFIDVRDVQQLRATVPNILDVHLVPYNHIEFISASDAKEVLYKDIVQLIAKYSQR